MDNGLNIYTLTLMVRGFSNEVTVNWLASRLGISYSTLARCKSGVWPRSVTFDAMRRVLGDCRDKYFEGSADAFVESATGYLSRHGVDTAFLESAYAQGGYDAFVSELLVRAREPDAAEVVKAAEEPAFAGASPQSSGSRHEANLEVCASTEGVPTETGGFEAAAQAVGDSILGGAESVAASETNATSVNRYPTVLVALPVIAILLLGLLNIPLAGLFAWAREHPGASCAALLAVAVLPTALGVLVDAPLAWMAYKKSHPEAGFSWHDFALVSKYGDVSTFVPGAGRFDLSGRHCLYQAGCNLLGAMCSISLGFFLAGLPGFVEFFETHEWVEFFKVGVAVGFFVAFSHNAEIRKLPRCSHVGDNRENPDVYLPTRCHVWANSLHLVVTFSLVCILTLGLLAYSLANFRVLEPPLLILWPLGQTIVFLGFSSVSRLAREFEAQGVGAFVPGVAASALGVACLVALCYRPSWQGAVICGACFACLALVAVWFTRIRSGEHEAWLARGRKSASYSLAVVSSVCAMLAIGIATTALL